MSSHWFNIQRLIDIWACFSCLMQARRCILSIITRETSQKTLLSLFLVASRPHTMKGYSRSIRLSSCNIPPMALLDAKRNRSRLVVPIFQSTPSQEILSVGLVPAPPLVPLNEMAHPAFWPTKSFFYPVGNTPPLCLTQNLPPEADANILLLGCGDPRNILYTLFSNAANQLTDRRHYDITCCDIEPAILARNILLFTLVADLDYPGTSAQIWNIFYYFYLDEASYALLLSQCRKLSQLSADIETWNTSEYSTFLRVSSRFTLSELNRLWTLYAATDNFTSGQRKQLKAKFETEMKGIAKMYRDSNIGTGARAAGPLHFLAWGLSGKAYAYFWRTGLTTDDPRQVASASIVNPTFAYTAKTEGCLSHYGTFPLPAFHLAPAFAASDTYERCPPKPTIFDLFRFVKSQFAMWCEAFRERHQKAEGSILLRFLVGDVFATCFTLQAYAERGARTAHQHTTPWTISGLTLTDDYDASSKYHAPHRFLLIDTSNLADHMGMLNLLPAAAPLLACDAAATLFTETLLSRGDDPTKSFADRLCCDPYTFFVLLDLVPSGFLSGFTTQSNVHEILEVTGMPSVMQRPISRQYHERMAWRKLSIIQDQLRPVLSLDPAHVSGLLYDIYLRMFSHEDESDMFRQMSLSALKHASVIHYCRRSFVLLIRHISNRVDTDWDLAISNLLERVRNTVQLLVGMNFYQELLCHLHIFGLYDGDRWFESYPADKHSGRFRPWKDVPDVVCIVMSIPRQHTEILNVERVAMNGPLQAQILSDMFCNVFVSIQLSFGTMTVIGENENAEIVVSEDARGRHGDSDAVIAFWVPTWVLCLAPERASVLFGLVSTPANALLVPKLGLQMKLYSARLMDTSKVHISRKAPITAADRALQLRPSKHPSDKSPQAVRPLSDLVVTLDNSCRRIVSMTQRVEITNSYAKVELSKADTSVSTIPTSGSGIELSIGSSYRRGLYFPAVTDSSKARLRIARKSSWVEVILPVSDISTYPLQNLSLVSHDGSVSLWNMHYLDLDCLPSLQLGKTKKLEWLNLHIYHQFSDAEAAQLKASRYVTKPLAQVKQSIHALIDHYAGVQKERADVFALNRRSEGGIDTIIFATHLRLDLSAHTVVLDAYVLPLEEGILDLLAHPLGLLTNSGLISVIVNTEELVVWKHLLPALTERCRTWKHKDNCAYIRRGAIPLSIEHGGIPICHCGRGIVSGAFKAHKQWAPFAPYVTRVAISPIFALSYLESVGQTFTGALGEVKSGPPSCAKCGKRPPEVKLFACSVCKLVSYCGKGCQRTDWGRHKSACKKV